MKYHLITFGCQMNKSDSERIATVLENIGYKETSKINEADLIIVNMCSVRQKAVDRVYGMIKNFNRIKKQNPNLKIILTGCVLLKDKNKFKKWFDLIFDIKDLPKLTKFLTKQQNKQTDDYLSILPAISSPITAYVPIMTGCNNFCAYCVVPYTRGREISRSPKIIIAEIKKLLKDGYKEIILLGQNVNSYQKDDVNFSQLLKMVDNLQGKFWLRFITNHPKDLTDELINTIAECKKVGPYMHLPIQAGNDQILKKMNRHYTVSYYKNLIKKLRKKIQNLSISTDIIVGFPGETKNQFNDTAKLMRSIKFDMAYLAQYSPRPQTLAAKTFKDNVPKEEKKQREEILNEILKKTALKNNEKYIGKIIEVLIIGYDKKNNLYGVTDTFKHILVKFGQKKLPIKIGNFYNVKITQVASWGLEGCFQLLSFRKQ
ncbi:MAG: tRNA (N6-isopentenyl adenosine(37)-C2)-methylthiotransferase MiaB [Patescibacteria group bacterium]|nr:tRNA (N6-isopentenyl adenosine(37)-C2)-methylthiotransferase MiaB [Patescibacteria group bacterium]